jgi:hypothetical protein
MRRALGIALALLGVLAACAGKANPTPPTDVFPNATPEQTAACVALERAVYESQYTKCPNRDGLYAPQYDEDTYVALYAPDCLRTYFSAGSNVEAGQMLTCAAAIQTVSCRHTWAFDLLPACQFPPGARDDGAPCGVDSQCKSWSCNRKQPDPTEPNRGPGYILGLCGTCAPSVPLGGSCSWERWVGEDCAEGSRCEDDDKCVATVGAIADTCMYDEDCSEELLCTTAQVCAPPGTIGAPCTRGDGSDSTDSCGDDSFCSLPVGGTCMAFPQEGERCVLYALCAAGLWCQPMVGRCSSGVAPPTEYPPGVPLPIVKPGDPCGTAECEFPSTCVDGYCKYFDPAECPQQ